MNQEIKPFYDVIIMGGGPAGSTLGALLKRRSGLSVAIFEKERFPREHIGESFAHPTTSVMEESGVLDKVVSSEFAIKKFGGIYAWDQDSPFTGYFDHANWKADGSQRWTVHVNRPEFDELLLDHASELGAEVFQNVRVVSYDPDGTGGVVTLKDGRSARCSFFVDASGRQNSIAVKKRRSWLSDYKNIAIWQHYLDCRPAQSLQYDWNLFRNSDQSPIGTFAFRDGWCWYIPVRRIVNGERRTTYSVGIVTNPEILKRPEQDLTDPKIFLRTIQNDVPLLRDLVQDAVPVDADRMLTATNYSMINSSFADFDERWILIGDAAYFVDPLFSTGTTFALTQASCANLLISAAANPDLSEQDKRDLWRDYDTEWHGMAKTYALSIDQWYYAIGKKNPDSIYWQTRGGTVDLGIRDETFHALLSNDFLHGLLGVMTKGTGRLEDLDQDGPYIRAALMAEPEEPDPDSIVRPASNVAPRRSLAVEVPGFKAVMPPPPNEVPPDVRAGIAHYWKDPVRNSASAPSPHREALACHRFAFTDGSSGVEVRSIDTYDHGAELWNLLGSERITYGDLIVKLTPPETALLKRLILADMVVLEAPTTSSTTRLPDRPAARAE